MERRSRGRLRSRSSKRSGTPYHRETRSNSVRHINQYDILDTDVGEHEQHNRSKKVKTVHDSSPETPVRNEIPPPIIVKGIKSATIEANLKSLTGYNCDKLLIKIERDDTIKLLASDVEQFKLARKLCADLRYDSYTYSLKSEKKTKIILSGLENRHESQLADALADKRVFPCKTKMITPMTRDEKNMLVPVKTNSVYFLLYFEKDKHVKIESLRQITGILGSRIKWKYYSPRRHGPVQCMNCQEYGHGQDNCMKTPKCVRCAGAHKSRECIHLPKNEDGSFNYTAKIASTKVKCSLCGDHHTANYSKCKKRIEFEERQRKIRQTQSFGQRTKTVPAMNPDNFPTLPSTSRRSWSEPQQFVQPSMQHSRQSTSRSYANVAVEPNQDLFSAEECFFILQELIVGIQNCRTKAEQGVLICKIGQKFYSKQP